MSRKSIPSTVRDEVLREAGYKCANPTCRNILTLQLHHIVSVTEDGGNEPMNLLALCGHCHDLHEHGQHIPGSAIRHWKGMLHALNHAFSKESMDLLLYLNHSGVKDMWYSADGVLRFAPLIAAGLVGFGTQIHDHVTGPRSAVQVHLTDKGKQLVDAWLKGDEDAYAKALTLST